MAYIDYEFVKDRMKDDEYTKLSRGDDANVTAAIKIADSEIDSWISSKYTTPLDEDYITEKIKGVSFDITMKELHSGIQFDEIPEFILDNYKLAMKWLERVSDGKARIPNVATADKTEAVTTGGWDPVMNRKLM